ncbi:unnamed protein product [Amoebophrya sp. A120]|nr:unnamed protein product [Amoebophrya sp. A120]|eukprot:GSA120T00023501001.1
MEILIYLLGNLCCIAAAGLLAKQLLTSNVNTETSLHISKDLQYMLFFGSVFRLYWSLSPPEIWSEEATIVQYLCFADLAGTVLLWGLCAVLSTKFGKNLYWELTGVRSQDSKAKAKKPAEGFTALLTWPILSVAAGVLAWLATHVLPSLSGPTAWPFVDWAVVWNMLIDGMAMLPQILTLSASEEKTPRITSHFVGLLCVGRVLRMIFWIWLVFHPEAGHAMWTFILPDLMHSVVMADFLYHYVQKVKRDAKEMLNFGYDYAHAV